MVTIMESNCTTINDNSFGPAVQGCRHNFDFTLIFEQSILSIVPAALLLIFAPPRVARLLRSGTKTFPSRLRSTKALVCLLLIGVQLGLLICWASKDVTRATLPSAVISLFAAIAILVLSPLEHNRAVRPSTLLNIYLLVSLVFDAVQVRTLYLRKEEPTILGLFSADIGLKGILLLLESTSKRKWLRFPYNGYSPETTSGVFNRSFFWWLNPLLSSGFRKLLTIDDLFATDVELLSEPLSERMEISWNKFSSSGKYALAKAVFYCLRWSLASIIFPRLCLVGFNYAQPFLISSAINFVSNSKSDDKNDGYGLIGATALIFLGIAISQTQYQHRLNRSTASFRGAILSLIYTKTLKLQAGIYDESAAITLMSTDIDRLTSSMQAMCEVWALLIELAIGIWLLTRQIGWVSVAPLIITFVAIFCSSKVAKLIGPRQREWVQAIQRRVGMTSSMLGSMKSVKMMGLSGSLFDTLQNQRVRELDLSKYFRIMGMWRMILSFIPDILGPFAAFIIFAIQASATGSNRLSVSRTFSALTIISIMTSPASEFLRSLPLIGMATGCLERIQAFLLSEPYVDNRELPGTLQDDLPVASEIDGIELQTFGTKNPFNLAIQAENASISPSPGAPIAVNDVTFQATKGSLTMVIGVVGCGKSTLLKALVGELKCESGRIRIDSKRSGFCGQVPWLQNATVKEIIRGGIQEADYDERWYRTVLHACAFDEEVEALPDQDNTLIGSRGVTLSGGQKQRLALARAVYARLEIVVLDDILSAIDARTEALVVDRLLGKSGIFKKLGTTVVLATHAVRHLPLADNIIVLSGDGKALEQGTFETLRSRDGFISKLILHPEMLESGSTSNRNVSISAPPQKKPVALPKALRGLTANDEADLTRRTGDFAVYKYYLKSIGWKICLLSLSSSLIYALALRFPPLLLTWYADGTIKSLALFSSVWAASAVVAFFGATMVLYSLYMKVAPKSGAGLHKIFLRSVLGAPQSFFDKTDSGITLNRFSQDMTLIDGSLPQSIVMCSSVVWTCILQFALIATGSSYMALTCPFLVVALYFLQKFYLRTSRQMRFLDLEAKSPLYTHFMETLEGLSTIRSFGWQEYFLRTNLEKLDASQKPYYMMYCIQRWLNLVLQLFVGAISVIVVALATSLKDTTSAGRLGVSLSAIVTFNYSISMFMMFWVQLETSIGAISRLKAFEQSTVSENKPEEISMPSKDWPSNGAIELKSISASYRPAIPALRDLSFSIKSGEKVGICGRTGSGKSSLLSVLLRILDLDSGTISIDNLDLSLIPRETIRSRLVTIPQEPFILAGSVRLNADPAGVATDSSIVTALQKVGLWDILSERGGLDAEMTAAPLSHGQQQIFCLARAMLKSKGKDKGILVLDEATSNVDSETDKLMQRLVREEFDGYTIVTVAHRLDTIPDSDKVMVLDAGRLVEFGEPGELLERKGAFWELRGGRA